MQINKIYHIKLYTLIIVFTIFEAAINSSSILYIDLVGIFVLSLLVNKMCLFRQLILFSIIADLTGRWYLGTHLFTLILISFFSDRYHAFYKLSNISQKNIFFIMCAIIQSTFIALIGIITNNFKVDIISFATEILVICPLVFMISTTVLKQYYSDMLY